MTTQPHSDDSVKKYQDTVREAERKLEQRIGSGTNIAPSEAQAARKEYEDTVAAARADLEKQTPKTSQSEQPQRRP